MSFAYITSHIDHSIKRDDEIEKWIVKGVVE